MFSMPIVDLLEEGRKLADTGRRVSVLWQHCDTLVFLARGREYRSEFHINPSDETMQMIKGEMRLHYRTPEGKEEIAVLAEGAIIYTPAGTPHSPRFPPDAFALISERKRRHGEIDRFHWYCRKVRHAPARRAFHRGRLRARPGLEGIQALLRQQRIPHVQQLRRSHAGAGIALGVIVFVLVGSQDVTSPTLNL